VKLEPVRVEPEFAPRIWGARSLAPLYPEKTNLTEPIGEAWLTGLGCKLATGPFAGRDLRAAWETMPPEWRGTRLAAVSEFPILAKFIFPKEKLSIQVHPDDAFAQRHETAAGGRGKTEMWHVISAEPGAQLLLGTKPGVSKEAFAEALAAGTLEEPLQSWPVRPGDTFFVPARTPHTIGGGMILCEIQQYSDVTYRVYDYGRVDAHGKPRELHIDKALAVINFGRSAGGRVSALPLRAEGMKRFLLSACRYFASERWELASPAATQKHPEHFDVFVILSGRGTFAWDHGAAGYRRGEAWLIPAALGRLRVTPNELTTLLRTYVPDLDGLEKQLLGEGADPAALSQVVFT